MHDEHPHLQPQPRRPRVLSGHRRTARLAWASAERLANIELLTTTSTAPSHLIGAHCPVCVTRIRFGDATPEQVTATLHAYFDSAAGGIEIRNRAAVLEMTLRFRVGRPV